MAVRTPKLDFSYLDQRSAIENAKNRRERAVNEFIKPWRDYADKSYARRAKQKADMAQALAYDTNITGNNIVNKAAAREWKEQMDYFTGLMNGQKGVLTQEQKVDLQTAKAALHNDIIGAKKYLKDIEVAKNKSFNNPGITMDSEAVENTFLGLGEGSLRLSDLSQYGPDEKYDAGVNFLSYEAIDPKSFEAAELNKFKKESAKAGTSRSVERVKGGSTVKTSTQETSYGDADEFIDNYLSKLQSQKLAPNFAKSIHSKLSDEEKQKAVEMYPESKTPIMEYYYRNKKRGDFEKGLIPSVEAAVSQRPQTKSGSGKVNEFAITEKDGSWDMRGKPQRVTGTIETFQEDGKPKKVKGTNSMVTKLNYGVMPGSFGDEQLYVSVLIPKSGSDIQRRILEGEDIPQNELFKELLTPDKSEEVYVPYEDLEDVLKKYQFDNIDKYKNDKKEAATDNEWDIFKRK